MPKFNLTDAEISTLADYMMTVYQTPAFDRDEVSEKEFTPALVQQGRELFYGKYDCQSCHIVDSHKDKGYVGPALWSVGTRLTPAWIAALSKRSTVGSAGHDRTEPAHYGCRRESAHGVSVGAEVQRQGGGKEMKTTALSLMLLALMLSGCSCHQPAALAPKATAYGTAIVLSSGDKQIAGVGNILGDPVVVQVNDAQGNSVTGAPVWCGGPNSASCNPASGLTDSSGQFTTSVSIGGMAGRYQITAATRDAAGKRVEVKVDEIALGYQQTLGHELNEKFCARCHNSESSAARVSNFDNLTTKPHQFSEGDTLNKVSDDDLTAVISHGGPALSKSAEMPPFGYTLGKSDIQALIAYIRAVSDPPYRSTGLVYAKAQ